MELEYRADAVDVGTVRGTCNGPSRMLFLRHRLARLQRIPPKSGGARAYKPEKRDSRESGGVLTGVEFELKISYNAWHTSIHSRDPDFGTLV